MADSRPFLPSLAATANDAILNDILQTVQLKEAHLATGRNQGVRITAPYVILLIVILPFVLLTHSLFVICMHSFVGCMAECLGFGFQSSHGAMSPL
jgi:hypothetical protein